MDKFNTTIDAILKILTAAPIGMTGVVSIILTIAQVWRTVNPDDDIDLIALASKIEAATSANAAFGQAEIERLKAKLAQK